MQYYSQSTILCYSRTDLCIILNTFLFATFQQSSAPQKQKRSLKGVSQKMATMSRVDMNKKEVKPSQLNTGMIMIT